MLTKAKLLKFIKKFSKSFLFSISDRKCTNNNNNSHSEKGCRKCSKLHKRSTIYFLREENDEDDFFIDSRKMCLLQKQRATSSKKLLKQ